MILRICAASIVAIQISTTISDRDGGGYLFREDVVLLERESI
jgi:hypothetical protein